MKKALPLLVLAVSLLAARQARALNVLAVDLVTDVDTAPGTLCVLSPEFVKNEPENGVALTDANTRRLFARDHQRAERLYYGRPDPQTGVKEVDEAIELMQHRKRSEEAVCGAEANLCQREFVLPLPPRNQKWVMRCTKNTDVSSKRVLVITLERSGEDQIPLRDIGLHGRSARLILTRVAGSGTLPTAAVAGGDYQPGDSAQSVGGRIALPLEPLCVEREITLPRARRPTEGAVILASMDVRGQHVSCDLPWQGTARIRIPRNTEGRRERLELRMSGRHYEVGSFASEWTSAYPPPTIELRAIRTTLSWRAPCEYPRHTRCPRATLPEAGVECRPLTEFPAPREDADFGVCEYSCGPRTHSTASFAFPAQVRFRGGHQKRSWDGTLSYAGQSLEGAYVGAADRQFVVVFNGLPPKERPGDTFPSIDMVAPSTGLIRVPVRAADGTLVGSESVALPGISCGQQVVYRWVGTRRYHDEVAEVRSGTIAIAPPDESSVKVTVGAMLGGGIMFPTTEGNVVTDKPAAIVQVAGRWRPGPTHYTTVWIPQDFELHASYLFAQEPYVPVKAPSDARPERADSVPYDRFIAEVAPVWNPVNSLQIGVTPAGVGLGFPVLDKDKPRVGGADWFWVASFFARWLVSRHLSIEGFARYFHGQQFLRFKPSKDFYASPVPEYDRLSYGFFGLGARWWL